MVDFLREFFEFLRERKKLWLAPVLAVLLLLGAVLVFTPGALSPFIYSLF